MQTPEWASALGCKAAEARLALRVSDLQNYQGGAYKSCTVHTTGGAYNRSLLTQCTLQGPTQCTLQGGAYYRSTVLHYRAGPTIGTPLQHNAH